MKVFFAYMTAGNMDEARRISRDLVENRLAACVNIIGGVISVYRWEGNTEEESEISLIAKTTEEALPELVERVKSIHSYQTPCVVGIPTEGGNRDFIRWIEGEAAGSGGDFNPS